MEKENTVQNFQAKLDSVLANNEETIRKGLFNKLETYKRDARVNIVNPIYMALYYDIEVKTTET